MSSRKEFVDQLKSSLDNLDEELETLELRVEKANEELRLDWEKRKLELAKRRAQLVRNMEAARNSADDTWHDIKKELLAARDKLEQGLKDVRRQFSR